MKKQLFMLIFLCSISSLFSQLYISNGEILTTQSNVILSVREDSIKNNGTMFLNAGQIYVSGHFINAGTIDAATSHITFNGASLQKLKSNGTTYYDLTLNNTSTGVELTDNASMNGELRFLAGVLNTTLANILTLNPSANVVGEANGKYVKGALETIQNVDGTTPVSFSGMGVVIDAAGQNLGNVSISRKTGLSQLNYSYFYGNAAGGNPTIDRIWDIDAQNAPATPVSLTLNWLSSNNNGVNLADAQTVYHLTNGLSLWLGASAPNLNYTGLSTTVNTTHFSKWSVLDNTNGPLAVVNLAFIAHLNNDKQALLNWSTEKEINCAYYVVERSVDNKTYEFFAQVTGNGTTDIPHTYQTLDKSPAIGVTYYRLKQVDFDGTFYYSEIESVLLAEDFQSVIAVFPNPSNGNFSIQTSSNMVGKYLTLTDAIGREIMKMRIAEPYFELFAPVSDGVYFLKFANNGEYITKKIIIQK